MNIKTEKALEKWFSENPGDKMEVDIFNIDGEWIGEKEYSNIYEILADYDYNNPLCMAFPI
jgi:hypothetical protein